MQGFKEECGIVGIIGDPEAAGLAYLALFAQQHRGQEGCGIVTYESNAQTHGQGPSQGYRQEEHRQDPGHFHAHKSFGLVSDSFSANKLAKLRGEAALGHVRYSTQGGRLIQNVQPFHFKTAIGGLSVAHNGNLTNGAKLRQELEESGSIFQSTSDTEVFIHLLAKSRGRTVRDRIFEVMTQVKGAYSMVILSEDRLFAVRDPHGFRPFVLGQRGSAYIAASETCALDLIDAQVLREVEPGEVVEMQPGDLQSHFPLAKQSTAFCAFEPIYFARPDSLVYGEVIYNHRKKMGTILAREAPAEDADIVIAVPDSGVPMAMGFSEQSGLSLELGLVRNHYVGRTFIQPAQDIRDFGVKLKLNPVVSALKGRSVVVVDDSIVRGTTCAKIMRMLRSAGVKKIHMRIGSPPITHSCYYGVDTPHRDKLLAAQKNVDEIKAMLGCDSLAYLSIEGLREALGDLEESRYCTACFNGNYPEEIFADIKDQPTDINGPGLRA